MNPNPLLSVLMADAPAAHERLANVLRRRAPAVSGGGGAVVCLATGEAEGMVRATISLGGSRTEAEMCRLQIEKMVDVAEAALLDDYVGAQLVVLRLRAIGDPVAALGTLEAVGARPLRQDGAEIVAQIAERPERIEAALERLRGLGDLTVLRTGLVAMAV